MQLAPLAPCRVGSVLDSWFHSLRIIKGVWLRSVRVCHASVEPCIKPTVNAPQMYHVRHISNDRQLHHVRLFYKGPCPRPSRNSTVDFVWTLFFPSLFGTRHQHIYEMFIWHSSASFARPAKVQRVAQPIEWLAVVPVHLRGGQRQKHVDAEVPGVHMESTSWPGHVGHRYF